MPPSTTRIEDPYHFLDLAFGYYMTGRALAVHGSGPSGPARRRRAHEADPSHIKWSYRLRLIVDTSASKACQTACVAFHDSFWVLAGTAAPVIALAAVLSAREVDDLGIGLQEERREWAKRRGHQLTRKKRPAVASPYDSAIFSATATYRIHMVNLILQTVVLGISLLSLADASNLISPLVAVACALAGMALLALGYTSVTVTNMSDPNRKSLLPDDRFTGKGDDTG